MGLPTKKPVPGPKPTKKNRKWGRNKAWCEKYRAGGRRERNKARRIARHVQRNPGDLAAKAALDRMKGGGA